MLTFIGLVLFPATDVLAQVVSTDSLASDTSRQTVPPKKDDIKHTINYFAKDSIWFDVKNQVVQLHGGVDKEGKPGAHIDYGKMQIDAAYIEIDWLNDLVTARGIQDSTGEWVGQPIFIDDDQEYELETIGYNVKNDHAIIKGAFTEQNNDYIYTYDTLAKDEYDNVYIKDGYYCPCDDPNASTFIKAKKIKVVPGKRVVSGPFNLWIADVPTPLLMPFGLFPISGKRTSGVLFPQFSESEARGFAIQNGGYYWAVNDYVGVKTLFDVYSKGGWSGKILTNYIKKYRYNGELNLRYSKFITNSDEVAFRSESRDFWVDWNHRPVSRGGKSFSASVNAGSQSYNSINANRPDNYLSSNFRSNISYRTPIGTNSPFNLTMNLRHNQNVQTGKVSMDLPDINLAMNRQYPFKSNRLKKSQLRKSLETFNFSYNMNLKNEVTTHPLFPSYGFNIANPEDQYNDTLDFDRFGTMLARARNGIRHSIPVSMTMNIGALSLSPYFNYTDVWYTEHNTYEYDGNDSVNVYRDKGFSRVGYYSTGASLTTRLYGFYGFKGKKEMKIRQTVSPSITYTYTPDFSDPAKYNGWQEVQVGTDEYNIVSKYQGYLYGGSGAGENQRVSLSINTIFDAKHNVIKDTSTTVKKYKLIDNFGFNTGYNFVAEEFKLSPFNFSLRTTILKLLSVNSSMTVDPYVYVKDTSLASGQERKNVYAWDAGGLETNTNGIGAVSNYSLALTASLSPKTFKREKPKAESKLTEEQEELLRSNYGGYVDFSLPWSFNFTYNYRYSKAGFLDPNRTQSLRFDGSLSFTEKWNASFSASYDFELKEIIYPNVSIHRDLGCWEMNFTWVPYGPRYGYFFSINIKNPILKELKLTRNRFWYDR